MSITPTRAAIFGIAALLFAFIVGCGAVGRGDTVENKVDDNAAAPPEALASQADGLRADFGDSDIAQESAEEPGTGSALPALLDRKIVQSASIDIQVDEVGRNFQEIVRIAETAGGFVASSSFSNLGDQQVADLTVRVPSDALQAVLADIRGMGDVQQESSNANDVTEEYTDLQARVRTLEATEQRYLELLAQADTVNDILVVQDRLDSVRGQVEQVQGRINLLDSLTDLATITVHLQPLALAADAGGGGSLQPLAAAGEAWEASLATLRVLAAGVLIVAVFSWWLLPPLAALGVAVRWWLNRQPRPAAETSA